ncbi:UBX domain-containing protein 1-A [Echinococcus granulosus]|nr:UBX domain-containing protein 1-A [Echinococcus granulosus]
MDNDIDTLVQMGWKKEYAEKALSETNHQGLEAAINCNTRVDDLGINISTLKTLPQVPQSFVCEECGRPLRSNDDVELHSARTGHINFKESADKLKPLTDEEKQVQMRRLEEAIVRRKMKREEEERQKCLQDEKNRRLQGKAFQSAKAMFREEMMRREAEQLKRDRAEDKAYREKLLAEIEAEKAERIAKRKGVHSKEIAPAAASQREAKSPNSPAECRLQIRTPFGQPLRGTFKSSENLGAVVLYVSQNWPMHPDSTTRMTINSCEITLQTAFPNRKFGEEDLSKTLNELGLCPTAVLMARRNATF